MFNQNILNLSFFLMFLLFSATSCGEVNQKSSEQPGRSGEEPPSGQSSQSELLVKLIAHRGGIVNENGIENSRAAMEEAIRRGYWMLEIDLRKTKDGRIILHHDSNFERYYDEPRSVSELTWEEIQELRSEVGGSRPLLFEEAAELASGRIRFMLDIKGGDFEESDYMEIESVLEKYGLLNSAFVLSDAGAQ
ncbi:MAG TPA: glycerophosphodiester phosphodiesterase family protein, partial [Balneolaceae bacterium]|nr:glycerophosphodiester phosphodiesterase family protein [Balneolaceae bacterium]